MGTQVSRTKVLAGTLGKCLQLVSLVEKEKKLEILAQGSFVQVSVDGKENVESCMAGT